MKNRVKYPLFGVSVLAVIVIIVIMMNKPAPVQYVYINNQYAKEAGTEKISESIFDESEYSINQTTDYTDVPLDISDYLYEGETTVAGEDLYKFLPDKVKLTEEFSHDETTEELYEESSEAAEDYAVIEEKKNSDFPEGVSCDDWNLILINKQNYVPEGYELKLVDLNGNMKVDERIAAPLAEMIIDAKKSNVDLMICSAYRSYDRQTALFNNKINKLMNAGMSYYDAYRVGSYSVTIPGTSEHQIGMALDIVTPSYTSLDEGFADTDAGKWLKDNAHKYGFILRYLKGKEHITGITFEPWHFRYVGVDNAEYMTDKGITLEEYIESLTDNN